MKSEYEKSPERLQSFKAHQDGAVLSFPWQEKYNTLTSNCQEPLSRSELDNKFSPKKKNSLLLSESYSRLGETKRAERTSDCGSYLSFAHELKSGSELEEQGKLYLANFCKDRLCPMCAWRRSYKIFGQVSQVMEAVQGQFEYIFVTFTIRSVPGDQLPETITRMLRAYDKLMKRKKVKSTIQGFFRALEITRNNDEKSKSYGLYHPHFHCVFAVSSSYFGRNYIKRDEWLYLWQEAYKDDTITQVDVRRARDKMENGADVSGYLSSAVAEIAKYAVKSSDFLFEDHAKTDEIVGTFMRALFKRRLVAFGGALKEAFAKLNLDDPEDGDLVHINERINPELEYLIVNYGWSTGTYKLLSSYILSKGGISE